MESDEGLYHATPQMRGRNAHESIDTKKASNRADVLQSLPVMSEKYKLMGNGRDANQYPQFSICNTQRVIDNIMSCTEIG